MNDKVKEALEFAETAHGTQMYGDHEYVYHLKKTVEVAVEQGFDEVTQIACALHDVLEDTSVSYNDLKQVFGEEVADIVYNVTDELGKNRKERKNKTYPKIRADLRAIRVKLCDRITNIEFAIQSNSKMLKLYINEHDEFTKQLLYRGSASDDNLVNTWKRLDRLVNSDRSKLLKSPLVSRKTAVLLRDITLFKVYEPFDTAYTYIMGEKYPSKAVVGLMQYNRILAPSMEIVQRWLRDVLGIHVSINVTFSEGCYKYKFSILNKNYEFISSTVYDKYEEALDKGLQSALTRLKLDIGN